MMVSKEELEHAKRCRAVVVKNETSSEGEYELLLKNILEKRLFIRTQGPYIFSASVALIAMTASIYFMTINSAPVIQLLNGVLFGFWMVQIGIIAHDLSHGQVFASRKLNRQFAVIAWCLICGLSERRWFENHNEHHVAPNHEGHDPDLDIFFVTAPHQIKRRGKFFTKYVLRQQHIVHWCAIFLVYPLNIFLSLGHLSKRSDTLAYIERVLIFIHFALLFYILFSLLPLFSALVFFSSVTITAGLYMALIFGPNHMGTHVLEKEKEFPWEQQIINTRDIRTGFFISYIFGGLNFQIEHHLFPVMSRYQLYKAKQLVRSHCTANNIQYNETTWLGALQEINTALKTTSATLLA